jgi:hypothetical protein
MDPILLATIAALPISIISFELFRASRSSRRNREERCGKCGGPLYAPHAAAGPSLIQGHLVCEPCASKGRRALTRSLIAAVSITGSTVLALAAVAVWAPSALGSHPWLPAVATALTYPPIFGAAIAWMKRANRHAAQRLGLQPRPALSASSDSSLTPAASEGATVRGARPPNER